MCVCIYARFQSKPKKAHVNTIKTLFKNLSGTINLSLFYSITDAFDLLGIVMQVVK